MRYSDHVQYMWQIRASNDLARHCRVGGSWSLVKTGYILKYTNAVKVSHPSRVVRYHTSIGKLSENSLRESTHMTSLPAMLKLSRHPPKPSDSPWKTNQQTTALNNFSNFNTLRDGLAAVDPSKKEHCSKAALQQGCLSSLTTSTHHRTQHFWRWQQLRAS